MTSVKQLKARSFYTDLRGESFAKLSGMKKTPLLKILFDVRISLKNVPLRIRNNKECVYEEFIV